MALMKIALLVLALGAHAVQVKHDTTPMAKVAQLLMEMRSRIESDGKEEQMSYDKYACWCETTLGRKAADISEAKKNIKQLQADITRLGAEVASHDAEIKSLDGDIAANKESQRDARSIRDKERADFEGEKTESEQCIGALESAIKVLTAGTRGGFLETMKEVELLSVVSGVRSALAKPRISKSMSTSDATLVHQFLEHPADYVGKRAKISAAQIGTSNPHNPFGDYAPQSTQIQGILRGMYQAFTSDLEEGDAREASQQKAFDELMATHQQELLTLEATHQSQVSDSARKSLEKDTSNEQLEDTNTQLSADEEFFETTKAGCKQKAQQWSVRSGLRSQELTGVTKAIDILTDPDSMNVFQNATTTFVQISAVAKSSASARFTASSRLAGLAKQYHSYSLAKLALALTAGGHFDEVIASIDAMIAALRREEQDDIAHRDRCQNAEGKNENDVEDLRASVQKAGSAVQSLQQKEGNLDNEKTGLLNKIDNTKQEIAQVLGLRNDDVSDFKQAIKDDMEAVALLDRTIVALARFYATNRISMSFIQGSSEPNYTVSEDVAPATTWANEEYGGRSSETHGLVEIIRMLKEDLEKEIKTSREDDAAAEAQYETQRADMQNTLDSQLALKANTERQLGAVAESIHDKSKFKDAEQNDLNAENKLTTAISMDCTWVSANFQTRRDKRKAEIDGLVDAKGYLAGAEDGSLI